MDQAQQDRLERSLRFRDFKDRFYHAGFTVGGISVIFFVLLIMFFFIYVVTPLFFGAKIDKTETWSLPGTDQEKTLYYGLDEYNTTALRVTDSGRFYGISLENGKLLSEGMLPLEGQTVTSFSLMNEFDKSFIFGLSDGTALIAKFNAKVSYPNKVKTVTPQILYPFGEYPIELADGAITKIAARSSDSEAVLVYQVNHQPEVQMGLYDIGVNFIDDTKRLDENLLGKLPTNFDPKWVKLGGNMRNLYLISESGKIAYYDISNPEAPIQLQLVKAVAENDNMTTVKFLLGEYSLLIGTDKGVVTQWFPVRDKDNEFQLQPIRSFQNSPSPIDFIAIEHARKGFAIVSDNNRFDLMHSTAETHVGQIDYAQDVVFAEISPRANGAVIETADGKLHTLDIENKHPDVSLKTLWGKVWYEGYEEPDHVWQSSSSSSDFEPKFSLMPLTFGTIKAALYSMLFAVPIAILAALYTAFFMDKKTRQFVKPAVELIEALPTVILGFLAGLWLAPMMEANLSSFFAIILILPIGIIAFGYGFSKLPENIRLMVPIGKRALLMIPMIVLLVWTAFQLNSPIENTFFDGDMRHWLTVSAGIDYDQRNAMVIGFAMGFALIPTIFSVAEDAIYNVPSYLVNGSLALGASGWQTVVGVVLPTASPGIFSAIMLGFGRGIGETMIILMASGNTPLMEVNIFEGMRTLAANLAVEMPETEVYSSHYRVLFLSGLILFIFTFFFNTMAEVVRERMRRKYGSL